MSAHPTPVPLTTLLSWVWVAFTIEADNAVEARGSERVGRLFRISMAMWANGLRVIDEEGVTVGDVRARARARCNLGGLERWGWITVGETGGKRRDGYGSHRGVTSDSVVRPTRAGSYARRLWPRVVSGVEQRWRARFGEQVIGSLRQALLPYAGDMPFAPPEVNGSDGFRTHVIEGTPGEAAGEVEGEAGSSLAGLMGQALTARTTAAEQDAAVSLPLAAGLLRVIGDGDVAIRDLPRRAGISKEAVAMATGYLGRTGLASLGPGRSIALTAAGLGALAGYTEHAESADDPRLRECLETIVAERAALAEGLRPPPGCWRGEKPYLSQTERVLAGLPATLPWHPMVLHRGGWPDGA